MSERALRWRPGLAACATTLFVLVTQRAVYGEPATGWVGIGLALALGGLAGRAAALTPRALWTASCLGLALAAAPVPLPAWLAAALPLLAVAGAAATARGALGGDPLPLAPALGGVTLALGCAAAARWSLHALGWVVYDDLVFALAGVGGVLGLGLIACARPPSATRSDPPPTGELALAALACFRCAAGVALALELSAILDAPRPWAWGALAGASALAGVTLTATWGLRARLLAELGGWGATVLLAWAGGLPLLALGVCLGAGCAGAAARPALLRSWRPLLAVVAGGLAGAALSQSLFAGLPALARARLALGSDDPSLADHIQQGTVRERFTRGGYDGVQVLDLGGKRPLRLLTQRGRVVEALPQRRTDVAEVLRARALAAALASWLAPGERLLVAGVGSGYGLGLLEGDWVAVEGSPEVASTWSEPGDLWGVFNGRLGEDPERLGRITQGPVLPHLRHGTFDGVLLPARPSPTTLAAALRHPLVAGPLTLSSGLAELEGWLQADGLLVFQPPESLVWVVVAGPKQLSWRRLVGGWERDGRLRAELERIGISGPSDLVACLVGGREAARLALKSPDPEGTLARAGAARGPELLTEADGVALVAITERLAAAGSPYTLRWAEAAVAEGRSAEALSTHGALLLNSGEAEAGRARLREALDLDPAHDPARLQLAFDLQREGDPAGAEALLRAGLRPDAEQPNLHYALAKLAEARDDPRAALAAYEAAGAVRDAAERARELRSALQREHAVGTQVKAAYALLEATRRGEAEPQQGLELALKLLDAELEREDRLLLARTLDGFAELEPSELLRANLQRHRARALTPLASEPRLAVRAAEAWLAGERPGEALALLEPLCATPEGARPRALRLLGDAQALRGEVARAREAYQRALSLGPSLTSNAATYEQLARLEAREGQLPQALELLQRGDAALGGVPRLRHTEAELLEALGREAEARAAWERYLEVAPPGAERRRVEARLGR